MSDRPEGLPAAKSVSASRTIVSQLMNPEHANINGDVHGGWIMKLADEAGGLSAMRHAQCRVVTVAVDYLHFHLPIRVGDLVILRAEVTYVGTTSMEVRVRVTAENPINGDSFETNSAYIVYVALDEEGNPKKVPELIAETPEQKRRLSAGKERQIRRKARKEEELAEQVS